MRGGNDSVAGELPHVELVHGQDSVHLLHQLPLQHNFVWIADFSVRIAGFLVLQSNIFAIILNEFKKVYFR